MVYAFANSLELENQKAKHNDPKQTMPINISKASWLKRLPGLPETILLTFCNGCKNPALHQAIIRLSIFQNMNNSVSRRPPSNAVPMKILELELQL